jgi:hypothetical protein
MNNNISDNTKWNQMIPKLIFNTLFWSATLLDRNIIFESDSQMKDLNTNQFYNWINLDYRIFKNLIYDNQISNKTKNLMFDLVTKCPNQKA